MFPTTMVTRKGFIPQRILLFVIEDITESAFCVEVTGNLTIDYKVRDYCRLPYPGHPEGCPHFGKREECPPQAPLIEHFIDLSKPHYLIIVKLNCDHAIEREKPHNPSKERYWLDWELHAESVLEKHVQKFQKNHLGTVFTLHPSAVGVDVFKTAQNMGIPLEPAPQKTFHKIALIGYPLQNEP